MPKPDQIKICNLIFSLEPGGAEKFTLELTELLNSTEGFESSLIVLGKEQSHFDTSNSSWVKHFGNSKYNLVGNIRTIAEIANQYDIIHAHLFPAIYYVSFFKILFRSEIKTVTTIHETSNPRRTWPIRILDNLVLESFNKIVCVSKTVRNNYEAISKKAHESVDVIENGVSRRFFTNRRSQKPAQHEKNNLIQILSIGRLVESKRIDKIISALKGLPDDYQLNILGDGPLKSKLISHAKSLGVLERVTFKGYVNDIGPHLNSCDVLVHASDSEGFGLAILEAMASELPILAPNIPTFKSLFGDSLQYYSPDGEPRHLAQSILEFLSKPELMRSKSRLALDISKRFDIKNSLEKHVLMYYKIKSDRCQI